MFPNAAFNQYRFATIHFENGERKFGMTRITNLLPSELDLADTLAGRISQIRDFRNMTVRDLAKAARMKVSRIEDIEAGLETWLSAPTRQIIAKALRIEPTMLQEVEFRPPDENVSELQQVPSEVIEELADAIIHGALDLQCPRCQSLMKCSVQEGIDLEGHPIYLPMAYCTKCPFVLK